MVLPFWYWLTQVVLEKRPFSRCSSDVVIVVCLALTLAVAQKWDYRKIGTVSILR